MKTGIALCALAIGAAALSTAAWADDPNDPAMKSKEAIAADRETIRQMNTDMLAQVKARDAAYAKGWRDYKRAKSDKHPSSEDYEQKLAAYHENLDAYNKQQARYAADRQSYEQAMVDWRRKVAACNAGNRSACR